MLFRSVSFEMVAPFRSSGGTPFFWYRDAEQMLIWNYTDYFPNGTGGIDIQGLAFYPKPLYYGRPLKNLSIRDSSFREVRDQVANGRSVFENAEITNSHFVLMPYTTSLGWLAEQATETTLGNQMLGADGKPLAGSLMLGRGTLLVPADAANTIRISRGAIGAFEYSSASTPTPSPPTPTSTPPPPLNQPPTISVAQDSYTVSPGETLTIDITATDPDGDAVTLDIANLDAILPGAMFE